MWKMFLAGKGLYAHQADPPGLHDGGQVLRESPVVLPADKLCNQMVSPALKTCLYHR
ncbi:MAG: hypothetical protein JW987_08880 [Anaerolineaceae bacterium]|nr:hypothetical protein [Anaerolineaceae bacterium]